MESSHRECYLRSYLVSILHVSGPCLNMLVKFFHNGLREYLSEELEKIQRRALRIIFPDLGYQEALTERVQPCHPPSTAPMVDRAPIQ